MDLPLRFPLRASTVGLFSGILLLGVIATVEGVSGALVVVLVALGVLALQAFHALRFHQLQPGLVLAREGVLIRHSRDAALVPWPALRAVAVLQGRGEGHLALSVAGLHELGFHWQGLKTGGSGGYNLQFDQLSLESPATEVAGLLSEYASSEERRSDLPAAADRISGRVIAVSSWPAAVGPAEALIAAPAPSLVRGAARPAVTYGLIAANSLIFFATAWAAATPDPPNLARYGALVPALVLQGQWWRLLTPLFLHASILHLVLNMTALLVLGRILESVYGPVNFLALYLLAGVGGNVASLGLGNVESVGASGAIMGVGGALAVVGLRRRAGPAAARLRRQMGVMGVAFLAPNIVFSFEPQVNWLAHVGGLATGAIAAMLLPWDSILEGAPTPARARALAMAIVILSAVGLAAGAVALAS